MLNNNYFGASQYPQGYTQPFNTQTYYQPAQPKPSPVSYASEEEVKGYFLSPNMQVFALDKEQPVFYIKTADNLGRSTLTKYRFEEIVENVQPQENVEYLTKSDIEILTKELDMLKLRYKMLEEKVWKPKFEGVENEQPKSNK